jgi:hypothetical protein
MGRLLIKFGVACTLAALVGCSSKKSSDDTTEDRLSDSAANIDVQVVSARSVQTIAFDFGGRFDAKKCVYSDKRPTTSRQYTAEAKADCTDEVARGQGRPLINVYKEPLAWIRENGGSIEYVTFRHWCTEIDVTVAVKAAAWDSESFEGIGFYADESTLNADEDDRRTFYAKDDSRLVRVGDATLKNGEKAYLYRFGGAGPCETNGSGDNPTHSIHFKPYMKYRGGIERWEAVSENHGLAYRQEWDRRGDLLR